MRRRKWYEGRSGTLWRGKVSSITEDTVSHKNLAGMEIKWKDSQKDRFDKI
jgi:hypothetical protein